MREGLINKRNLLILLSLALLGLAMILNLMRNFGPDRPTTYSAGAGGYKALYLWLERMGFQPGRWTRPLHELADEKALLFILTPEIPPGKKELEALADWVGRGGTLVILDSPSGEYLSSFGLRYSPAESPILPPRDAQWTIRPGPYTEGVKDIEARNRLSLFSDRPEVIIPIESRVGGQMAVVREGLGRVIAVSSPDIFSNSGLRKGDNARLAYNIVRFHKRSVLWFDEYHHGYGRSTSVTRHFKESKFWWPSVQLLVAFFLFWGLKGRRFGPPRPPATQESRSSMEYIAALANLFQQTKNSHYILQTVLKRIKKDSQRYFIQGDCALKQAFHGAEEKLKGQELTNHELLSEVKKLYQSFYRAKNLAPGGQTR